jgi:hypothetical protein
MSPSFVTLQSSFSASCTTRAEASGGGLDLGALRALRDGVTRLDIQTAERRDGSLLNGIPNLFGKLREPNGHVG